MTLLLVALLLVLAVGAVVASRQYRIVRKTPPPLRYMKRPPSWRDSGLPLEKYLDEVSLLRNPDYEMSDGRVMRKASDG